MAIEIAMTGVAGQSAIDQANREFWNELCGSQLARMLGITDSSPASLKRFDDWYFDFYPYLAEHIPFEELRGKRVLEVGLGYGTVAQRIAEAGAEYHGLDIAAGPVAMVKHRFQQQGLAGEVIRGSVLECPWPSESFDAVVAIGCLHHTGQLTNAIDEIHRVLKQGGRAFFMVYCAVSYRHWQTAPLETLRRSFANATTKRGKADEKLRGAYDVNSSGSPAPETEFVTKKELAAYCAKFSSCRIVKENIGADSVFRAMPRRIALRLFGPWLGLDLYVQAAK